MLSSVSYTFITPPLTDSKIGYSAVFMGCHTYHNSDLSAHDWPNEVVNTTWKMELTFFSHPVHFVIISN